MKAVLLGYERLGMISHLTALLKELGYSDIVALVQRPEVLSAMVMKHKELQTYTISNPFDPHILLDAMNTVSDGRFDVPFVCVQDRVTLSYLKALDLMPRLGDMQRVPSDGIRRSRIKARARELWNCGGETTKWGVLTSNHATSQHWCDIGRIAPDETKQYIVKPLCGSASESVLYAQGWSNAIKKANTVRQRMKASPEFHLSIDKEITLDGNTYNIFDDVLVEEVLEGAEFTIDGWVCNGELHFIVQHKEFRYVAPFFGDGLICSPPDSAQNWLRNGFSDNQRPSPKFTSCRDDFASLLRMGLRQLTLDNWGFHAEVIETLDGALHFVELNPRGAGGLLWQTAQVHLGMDPFEALLLLCLGKTIILKSSTVPAVTGQFPIYADRSGIFSRFPYLDAARVIPGVKLIQVVAEAGQRIVALDKENYLAFVHLHGLTHTDVRNAEREVRRLLVVEYK